MSREEGSECYSEDSADSVIEESNRLGINDLLAEEIIDKIFSYLDPSSVKAVRLVSRRWKHIIESAKFWTGIELMVDSSNLQFVLHSNLVKLVSGIGIIRGLKKGDFLTLFDNIFTKTDLKGPFLTRDQIEVLFRSIEESTDHKLKTVSMGGNSNISSVDPELLRAVVRLETCDLSYCDLNTGHLTVLFRAIQESTDLKLKTLHIEKNANISSVEPGLLQAVVRLENCNLRNCDLTTEQLTVLFRAILQSDLRLRELNLERCYLPRVAPALLVAALARLEEVNLSDTHLTTVQVTKVFRLVAERRSEKLKWINIRSNYNVRKVNQSLQDKAGENLRVRLIV